MVELTPRWAEELARRPETGMGYQIVTIVLKDAIRFDQVVIIDGRITGIRGLNDIPFGANDIQQIILTHDEWDFGHEPN